MPLPKIKLPIYELSLPSTGAKIKFHPFTVKEEKILLTAQESKDLSQIVLAIKQIINNCIIDTSIDDLAVFDLEYILIVLRSKSVDNTAKFTIKDPETLETIELSIDLNNVQVHKDEKHTNRIQLDDEYTLFMRYPTIDEFMILFDETKNSVEKNFDIMLSCLDKLASETEVIKFSDFTEKEVNEFVESLQTESTAKIKAFFDTLPKVRHEMKYKNSKGEDKIFVIQGTQSFFI